VKAWIDAHKRGPATIQPGTPGQFDIAIDGRVVYSRYQTGRFPSEANLESLQW